MPAVASETGFCSNPQYVRGMGLDSSVCSLVTDSVVELLGAVSLT